MKKFFAFFVLLAIIAMACNMPGLDTATSGFPRAIAQLLVTPDPNATPTPTPFQPNAAATEGASPIEGTPTVSSTATATIQPTLATSKDVVKIMVFGSDFRPGSGYRTDVIMLVAINKKSGATSVVSFPRDLYVTLPGYRDERINVAQPLGGFDLTQKTFQHNFGFTPDYYLMTNFQGFVNIVDSLGGITVNASRGLYDTCALDWRDEFEKCGVGPGEVYMDGETALWYVRSRYSTSDFDRTRRAQEVMKAIFNKLMNLNAIGRIPELYNAFRNSVEMNIPLDVIVSLGRFAPDLLSNPDKINQYAIGSNDVWAWQTPEGAQVLLPNPERIQPLLHEALNIE